MEIIVKSNFDLNFDPMEIKADGITLRSLLMDLGTEQHANVEFIDPKSNEVDDFFTVCINGREYRYLPARLDTRLSQGDEVRITVLPMGGGCNYPRPEERKDIFL
ncbi:MAG: hypothetical protein Q8P24_07845 [Desulfobacterales bacterium]|nr:hypothetical protein [Desulfobacterales bacterium]